ncbi:MAG: hypothetical protein AAF615_10270, partial [Pseudomonadota bacterium]
ADFGVEGLTNIYVSMGVTAPDYMGRIREAQGTAPKLVAKTNPGAEKSSGPETNGGAETAPASEKPQN